MVLRRTFKRKRLTPEFEMIAAGKGFIGILDDDHDFVEHRKSAEDALILAKEKMISKEYDIIILDEINYALNLQLLSINQVIELIKIRPKQTSIVLTGNYAPDEIIQVADLVTEMNEIKHPYQQGIKAKRGIDY